MGIILENLEPFESNVSSLPPPPHCGQPEQEKELMLCVCKSFKWYSINSETLSFLLNSVAHWGR